MLLPSTSLFSRSGEGMKKNAPTANKVIVASVLFCSSGGGLFGLEGVSATLLLCPNAYAGQCEAWHKAYLDQGACTNGAGAIDKGTLKYDAAMELKIKLGLATLSLDPGPFPLLQWKKQIE
ncbi:unnamed protein product, partial [Amoebophrya sp. A25]|eukprot:GSA25T00024597001.1